jgi:DNA-binding transcriptional LysR family regulator
MIDNLRAIYVFVKTVELGSLRAAAKELNISPSVVSYHLSRLETNLGVALLYRSTRKISLTNQGKDLYDSAKDMIGAAEAGLDRISEAASLTIGSLKLTLPAALSRGFIVDGIAKFALLHPNVEISMNFIDSNEDLISNGIDLAIRVGALKDSGLKSRKIFEMERKLVATAEYINSKPKPHSPKDLQSWDWVRFSSVPASRVFRDKNGRSSKIHFDSRIVVDSADALCQFVKSGLGLGTPPLFLVEQEIARKRLRVVLPDWRLDPLMIYGVWPANTHKNSLTNALIDHLINRQLNSGSS